MICKWLIYSKFIKNTSISQSFTSNIYSFKYISQSLMYLHDILYISGALSSMHFSKWLIIFRPPFPFVFFFHICHPIQHTNVQESQSRLSRSIHRDIFHPPDRYSVLEKIGSYQNIVVTSAAACSKSRQFQAACTASTLETVPGSRPQFQGDISIGSNTARGNVNTA